MLGLSWHLKRDKDAEAMPMKKANKTEKYKFTVRSNSMANCFCRPEHLLKMWLSTKVPEVTTPKMIGIKARIMKVLVKPPTPTHPGANNDTTSIEDCQMFKELENSPGRSSGTSNIIAAIW